MPGVRAAAERPLGALLTGSCDRFNVIERLSRVEGTMKSGTMRRRAFVENSPSLQVGAITTRRREEGGRAFRFGRGEARCGRRCSCGWDSIGFLFHIGRVRPQVQPVLMEKRLAARC